MAIRSTICFQLPQALVKSHSSWHQHGQGAFIHGEEGSTQGDPLAMFMCGLGTLPLICQLKEETLQVEQPWLTNDTAGAGKLNTFASYSLDQQSWDPNMATAQNHTSASSWFQTTAEMKQLLPSQISTLKSQMAPDALH